jgi:hypothetical protein
MNLKIVIKVVVSVCIAVLVACKTLKPIDNTCMQYRKGKFVQYLYNNSGLGHWHKAVTYIERGDSTETEILNSIIVDTFRYSVRWTSPCAFQLTFIAASDTFVNSMVKQMGNRKPKFKIVGGTDKYYLQRSQAQNTIDTIWIR